MATETVTVWLRAIEYSEGNIGSDTAFDISVNGKKPTHVTANLRPGTTRLFNIPVLLQVVKDDQVKVSISANVIEEDIASPDRGSNTTSEAIPRAKGRQSLTPVRVWVAENLGLMRAGRPAAFVFHFEAERWTAGGPGERYVVSDQNGWLLVRDEGGSKEETFSLPHLLKVEVTKVTGSREFFTVLEGAYVGRKGSVSVRNGVSFLSPTQVARQPAIQLVYHRATLSPQLEVPGLGKFKVAWPPKNPFPVGATFNVGIPDFPHDPGRRYEDKSTFATSWFRIADPKVPDRYLHVGRRSAGCSTVTGAERWDELYRFLINRRLDDRYIGTLTVVKT